MKKRLFLMSVAGLALRVVAYRTNIYGFIKADNCCWSTALQPLALLPLMNLEIIIPV